jgi:hypothetical protein
MALLEYCQSSAAELLLICHPHQSLEEVSINTPVDMLDAGEEEGEANGGRMDQHNNDDNGGEEEGVDCNDPRR